MGNVNLDPGKKRSFIAPEPDTCKLNLLNIVRPYRPSRYRQSATQSGHVI